MVLIPDKLLINLKILSKIQKNGRICRSFDGVISLDSATFVQPLRRFITSDSRKQTVFEITSIITECSELLFNLCNSKHLNTNLSYTEDYRKHTDSLFLLLSEMELARTGIDNLKFTYGGDHNTVSQLDIITIRLNNLLSDYKTKLAIFQSYIPNYVELSSIKIEQPDPSQNQSA